MCRVNVREHRTAVDWADEVSTWLDIVEIELNVMTRQWLSRRMADLSLLRQELAVWESGRNMHTACIQWHFTTNNARTKLYHSISSPDLKKRHNLTKYNVVSTS
ncbi:MAG: hypothetical protein HFG28_12205 [Eubacterium sp.]|nr:hypothetical protein [Eubacterium sp.]